VLINHNEEQIQLNKGQVIVTTISNKMVALDRPSTVLTVDSNGNTQGPIPMNQPLVNFADLGAPVTNTAFADGALRASVQPVRASGGEARPRGRLAASAAELVASAGS
jgi:hypothetical protein